MLYIQACPSIWGVHSGILTQRLPPRHCKSVDTRDQLGKVKQPKIAVPRDFFKNMHSDNVAVFLFKLLLSMGKAVQKLIKFLNKK